MTYPLFLGVPPQVVANLLAAKGIEPKDEPKTSVLATPLGLYFDSYYQTNDLGGNSEIYPQDGDLRQALDGDRFRAAVVNAATRFLYGWPCSFRQDQKGEPYFFVRYLSGDRQYKPFDVISRASKLVQVVAAAKGPVGMNIPGFTWNDYPLASGDVPWQQIAALSSAPWAEAKKQIEALNLPPRAWTPPPWMLQDFSGNIVVERMVITAKKQGNINPAKFEAMDTKMPWADVPWKKIPWAEVPWRSMPYNADNAFGTRLASAKPDAASITAAFAGAKKAQGRQPDAEDSSQGEEPSKDHSKLFLGGAIAILAVAGVYAAISTGEGKST